MLSARDLSKSYVTASGQSFCVLDRVDLDVESGTLVAVMGVSGSGKSTLLHLLATLDRPDRGRVIVRGHPAVARWR